MTTSGGVNERSTRDRDCDARNVVAPHHRKRLVDSGIECRLDKTVKKEDENDAGRGGRSVIVLLHITVLPTEGAIPDHLSSQGRSDHLQLFFSHNRSSRV
ncbi:hypothetical protein ANTRET_LOCUS703 [Anthophora retusa]